MSSTFRAPSPSSFTLSAHQPSSGQTGYAPRQKPEGFVSLEEVAEAIAKYQPRRKRKRNLDGLAKNIRLGADGIYRWHWDPLYRDRAGKFALEQRRIWLEACSARLALPTLLVRGALSDLLSESGAQAFLALCPQSEYANVADTTHMVAGDRNDVFGSAVVEFLSRVVPKRNETAQETP